MKIKCNYCGAMIDETADRCPNCGAPLSGANRTASEQPKTIEELKGWYAARHLPPEEITRFFIGKNIQEPKAFGIYQNAVGDFVVYKNKSTGERAIRYQGADEAYAVNELYQRLKAEIVDQKANRPSNLSSTPAPQLPKKKKKGCLIAIIVFFVMGILMAIFDNSAPNGYYKYNGQQYYHQGSSWYYYDANSNDWFKSSDAKTLDKEINNDNAQDFLNYNHTGKSFEESSWYNAGNHNDDSGWDNDNDWDSGSGDSWDNSSTDWDSDW